MAKEYFRVYNQDIEAVRFLSDEDAGKLFISLLLHSAGEDDVGLPLNYETAAAYQLLSARIDREREAEEGRSKFGMVGKYHPNWKGGVTKENQIGRNNAQYSNWRKSVFSRDKYMCQKCGAVGCRLNAHHIKPWAKYQDMRYSVNNGVTLCERCHKEEHGRK